MQKVALRVRLEERISKTIGDRRVLASAPTCWCQEQAARRLQTSEEPSGLRPVGVTYRCFAPSVEDRGSSQGTAEASVLCTQVHSTLYPKVFLDSIQLALRKSVLEHSYGCRSAIFYYFTSRQRINISLLIL